MDSTLGNTLINQLRRGVKSRAEMQAALGVSQPTLSRVLGDFQSRGLITPLGEGRARQYGLLRPIRGLDRSVIPIVRVTETGDTTHYGTLTALYPEHWWFENREKRGKLFDGLPWFIQDMRPQGFLGRAFPKLHAELNLPDHIDRWTEDEIIAALARRGEDCIGNLIVGAESFERFFRQRHAPVSETSRTDRYQEFARAALEGSPPGSSAGGEQPKFGAVIQGNDDQLRHVLVKFSPPGDSLVDQRWRDLLFTEYLALETIRNAGGNSPFAQLIEAGNRVFLEVTRFDRIASRGRLGAISLSAFDAEHFGSEDNWINAALRLTQARHISTSDGEEIRFLATFGRMIGNSDMHFGKLSLMIDENGYRLAPGYDMLPMMYAPINGQIVERDFRTFATGFHPDALSVWPRAAAAAVEFWRKVGAHPSVSAEFKRIARDNLGHIQAIAPVGT